MKLLIAVILMMIAYKLIGDSSQVVAMINQYRDIIIAVLLGLASKPLLKRLFS